MRHLFIVLAIALAAVAAGSARAGGWATVGLASTPDGTGSGEPWAAEITVLRHGVTPTDGAAPSLTIRHLDTGQSETFAAEPTGVPGVYSARVVFPKTGRWSFEIDNGLSATGYGESATTTYAPVTIGVGSGGSTASFSTPPLGVVAVAIALAAAGALGARRLRKLTPANQ